jgi:peptidoglycan/LPS O-acetylase OafA/YrhL
LFSVDFLQIAIFYGAVLFLTLLTVGSPRSRFLRSRTLCYFGRISYGLYLFHVPVLGVVFACGGWTSPTLETVGGYCAAILVSAISFHVIEKPILTFGQSVPYLPNPGAVGLETLGRARKADLDA